MPLWDGVLNSGRAIDWSQGTGIPGGVPNYTVQCGATIAAYTGTAATINNAIAACPTGQFVKLGSGTFNLSTTIQFASRGVVLRGSGPLQTIIKVGSSLNCGAGQGCGVQIGPTGNVFDNSASVQPGNSNSLNINGTVEGGVGVYPYGATHITVDTVGSDTPIVGTMLFMDQLNDTVVAPGILQGDNPNIISSTSLSGNDGSFGRAPSSAYTPLRRSQTQAVVITNISGSTYTISPGIYFNNIRASQSPGAWWNFSSAKISGAGVENLTLDNSTAAAGQTVTFIDAYQSWTKNVRMVCVDSGAGCPRSHYFVGQSLQVVIRDGYLFGARNGGGAEGYGIESSEASGCLIENNILEQQIAPWINDNITGCVFGYNFFWNDTTAGPTFMQVAYTSHDAGNGMNLYEGNDGPGIGADNQHGASPLSILFRNHFGGNQPVPNDKSGSGSQTTAMGFDSYNRVHSIVGNILGMPVCVGGAFAGRTCDENSQCTGGSCTGSSYAVNYETSPVVGCPSPGGGSQQIYNIGYGDGYQCNNSGGGNPGPSTAAAGNDTELVTSMMRWGNCDSVTNSCRFLSSEVPTAGGTFYSALSVPTNNNLPASFYYGSTPSWYSSAFGNPPWPPIGPDVTGGNMATIPAGLAYRIPARLCWENTVQDATNYPSTVIKAFDASVCYAAGVGGPVIALSPTSMNFGSVAVGYSSPIQVLTVTNTGSGTANLSTLSTFPGQFNIASFTCGVTLAALASCIVNMNFQPSALGTLNGTFSITDNAPGSPQQIPLTGIGVPIPTGVGVF